MNITHFLLPNTPEDTDKLQAFAISYSKAIDAGLPKKATDRITQAFLDNLKTLVDEKPTEKFYIHCKAADKRSESFARDYSSYDAAANVLRAAFPSHSDNRWKRSYEIKPVSGEQAYQDFLRQPISPADTLVASGGWGVPKNQAFTWPFPYEESKSYEIYHTGTNRPAAFFQGKTYYSRTAAEKDIQDTYAQTLKSVSLSEWLNTYTVRIKR